MHVIKHMVARVKRVDQECYTYGFLPETSGFSCHSGRDFCGPTDSRLVFLARGYHLVFSWVLPWELPSSSAQVWVISPEIPPWLSPPSPSGGSRQVWEQQHLQLHHPCLPQPSAHQEIPFGSEHAKHSPFSERKK